ncbi:MAG TPA: acetate--CoA ligase family protein [Stellaceae bacterium]|nr:acetate--CoA ligase family protein [Stellaceae bacterium]
MAFWTEPQMASIHKMLNPRSIAIVGATPRMQYGGRFLAAALKAKDRVRVYAVNPRYDDIMGEKSYPSVTDLPEAPDVVAVVVRYDQVLDVLQESHRKGAGSAIVISAGFAERGIDDRRDLQGELGEFARASGMRISGPNCLGLANVKDDIWATASSRGASGLTGPIGLVCQSGATAFGPFLVRAVENGIGFSYIISTGNEADLDFTDFARYLLDDPDTRVIAGFVEGFKRADKFLAVAKLAAARGKPIVLIKIGRSALGARAASSHTAALTGADARYDAVFAQYGVIRVQDYDELIEVAHLLAHTPKPAVPGIAVVSHSGGISSLTADMCGQAGLDLPVLGDAARDGINGILKGFGWAANPADVTGFANSESFPQIMEHMIADPRMGTLVVASAGADTQAQQVITQRDRTDKGVVFLWTGSRDAKAGLPQLKNARIPIFYTPDKLARGLQSRLAYHTWRERRLADGFATAPPRTAAQDAAIAQARALGRPTLSESESKRLLAAWGVASAREQLANSAEAAVAAAERLGFPVALKADSPDILHKTEAGVVRLNLGDAAQVRAAYAEILANALAFKAFPLDGGGLGGGGSAGGEGAGAAPQARLAGVSVQEMVRDGVEVIVGVSCDPQLGPVLLFGSGGVMVEVYNDVALRRCPITRAEAAAMIAEVKGARLLQGFRGRPAADLDALADTLVQVSHLAMHLDGHLAELDINPLMVLPSGQGVKAVDALVVLRM